MRQAALAAQMALNQYRFNLAGCLGSPDSFRDDKTVGFLAIDGNTRGLLGRGARVG
jgi:hypothetical protein